MEDNWQELRQKADNYRLNPRPADWEKVSKRLRPLKIGLFTQSLTAAAAVLLLLGLTFVLPWFNRGKLSLSHQLPGYQLERLNEMEHDKVAGMSIDYTAFLRKHHPGMMDTKRQ
jgi:hypothetical protein